MIKTLLTAAVLGLASLGLAAPAHADDSFVRTTVNWAGTSCIDVTISNKYSTYTFTKAVCGGSYTLTEGNVWPGDWIGIDPIMGSADYIECRMWINGVLSWSDAAYAGDGSDVNCLRTKL